MCRFLAYKGTPILLDDLIMKPSHSLIAQSYNSKERDEPLNGDGFGIGWYDRHINDAPSMFKDISPAWNNHNLKELSAIIRSGSIFAHVRAATEGLAVHYYNCHPFKYGNLLWMHNGGVQKFRDIKRKILNKVSDDYFNSIHGSTDSEHAFGLFLTHLDPVNNPGYTLKDMQKALASTLHELQDHGLENGTYCSMNVAVTDGDNYLFSRFSNRPKKPSETLYYTFGEKIYVEDGRFHIDKNGDPKFYLIASEATTYNKEDWNLVPDNNILSISADNELDFIKLHSIRNEKEELV